MSYSDYIRQENRLKDDLEYKERIESNKYDAQLSSLRSYNRAMENSYESSEQSRLANKRAFHGQIENQKRLENQDLYNKLSSQTNNEQNQLNEKIRNNKENEKIQRILNNSENDKTEKLQERKNIDYKHEEALEKINIEGAAINHRYEEKIKELDIINKDNKAKTDNEALRINYDNEEKMKKIESDFNLSKEKAKLKNETEIKKIKLNSELDENKIGNEKLKNDLEDEKEKAKQESEKEIALNKLEVEKEKNKLDNEINFLNDKGIKYKEIQKENNLEKERIEKENEIKINILENETKKNMALINADVDNYLAQAELAVEVAKEELNFNAEVKEMETDMAKSSMDEAADLMCEVMKNGNFNLDDIEKMAGSIGAAFSQGMKGL